jgi:hypothetical protein
MANAIKHDRLQHLTYELAVLRVLYSRAIHNTLPPSSTKPLPAEITSRINQLNAWINMQGSQQWTMPNVELVGADPSYTRLVTNRKVKEDKYLALYGQAALFPDPNVS